MRGSSNQQFVNQQFMTHKSTTKIHHNQTSIAKLEIDCQVVPGRYGAVGETESVDSLPDLLSKDSNPDFNRIA